MTARVTVKASVQPAMLDRPQKGGNPMNTRHGLITIAAAAAIAAALAGCNRSADANPFATATATTAPSATSATPASTTTTSIDSAAQETKDRQDAEQAWRKFNVLVNTVESLPADQVEAAINAVAVDPTATRLRNENAQFRAEHKAGYGQDISYITWPKAIAGADAAVLSDCQDGSQAGVLDVRTGNKLTVGTPNTPTRGTLQRTSTGWKVATVEILEGATCTPGH
jgi:hypothetical protein